MQLLSSEVYVYVLDSPQSMLHRKIWGGHRKQADQPMRVPQDPS